MMSVLIIGWDNTIGDLGVCFMMGVDCGSQIFFLVFSLFRASFHETLNNIRYDVSSVQSQKLIGSKRCLNFGVSMSKKNHHHGEDLHRMDQVPEKPVQTRSPDLLVRSRGNLPPAEIKRLTHPKAKRQAKKPPNKTQI